MKQLKKEKLQTIINDQLLMESLREIFDNAVEHNKPDVGKIESNNLVGEKYRAYIQAKKMIKDGFVYLDSLKINRENKENFNKGR